MIYKEDFHLLCVALIRPQLEYVGQIAHTGCAGDSDMLGIVQRKANKLVRSLDITP